MNSTKLSTKIIVAAAGAVSTLAAIPGFDDFVKNAAAGFVHAHPVFAWITPFVALALATLHNPKKTDGGTGNA